MKIKEGQIFTTKKCGDVEVIAHHSCYNIDVRFLDSTQYKCSVTSGNLRKGEVRNPYFRSLHGVGYIGEGEYSCVEYVNGKKKLSRAFNAWSNMISRCYSKDRQVYQPTYIQCLVHEDWHCFQNFAKWCNSNKEFKENSDWHLDKDILIKGNRLYSEHTCAFVPREVNNLFTLRNNERSDYPLGVMEAKTPNKYRAHIHKEGKTCYLGTYSDPVKAFYVYKEAKEDYIKKVAEKYKGRINSTVYDSLINWNVEVTD